MTRLREATSVNPREPVGWTATVSVPILSFGTRRHLKEFPAGIHRLSTKQAERQAGSQMILRWLWTAEGPVTAWDGSAGNQSRMSLVKSVHEALLLGDQMGNVQLRFD